MVKFNFEYKSTAKASFVIPAKAGIHPFLLGREKDNHSFLEGDH